MLIMLVTGSIVVAVACLMGFAIAAIVAALRTGGRRERVSDDREALSLSRFTIPVSIIVPVLADVAAISKMIGQLLALNYPEIEVVVVADGAPQSLLDTLGRDWQLDAKEFFYRRTLPTADVRRIYRSGQDARLMVIDKLPAGYADAVNCGINVARNRYVMTITPDVEFDNDALLRLMADALRDPAHVVGASNHVERVGFAFDRLASARSLMNSRLVWRHLHEGLGPSSAVFVWRRDAVLALKGLSTGSADPDLDMMLRLQTATIAGGRVDRAADIFGRTTQRMPTRSRNSWRVVAAALISLVRSGSSLGPKAALYYSWSEMLAPFTETWVLLATFAGAALGWYSWSAFALAVFALAFGHAAVTAAALLLRGSAPGAPDESELRSLLAVSPLEFFSYR